MTDNRAIFKSIKHFSNAGVWKSYKDSKSECLFKRKTLIYGFNGSGKTTLSRTFTSVQAGSLVENLPKECSFEFELTDGTKLSSNNLSSTLDKDLLVFNQDFIVKNFKWDDSTASPIVYLSEKKIGIKAKHEQISSRTQELQQQHDQLVQKKDKAEKSLNSFRTKIAKDVRERGRSKKYRQSFDARKIDTAYAEKTIDSSFIKADKEIDDCVKNLQQDEPLSKIAKIEVLTFNPVCLVKEITELLAKTPSSIMLSSLTEHKQMAMWVEDGLQYHTEQGLEECLLCGNDFSNERKKELEASFDKSWKDFVDELGNYKNKSDDRLNELRLLLHLNFGINDLQASGRDDFPELEKQYKEHVTQIGKFLSHLDELLKTKCRNPTEASGVQEEYQNFDIKSWKSSYEDVVSKLNNIILNHNKIFDDFSTLQNEAFLILRNHVLAEHLDEYTLCKKNCETIENELSNISQQLNVATLKKDGLANELYDHGVGAEKLKNTLKTYLGHSEIRLSTVKGGYQILRGDGSIAVHLSEGEKTAIAFCYFLTLFEAEGRQRKQLIVVIDDPISSLDTGAKTYAFSLMSRMTKNCAQTIILTHNLSFMNMVKREFMSEKYCEQASFLTIDCTMSREGSTRTSSLSLMSPLLKKYESEYHYLFSLVYDATLDNEGTKYRHLLPNIMRKVLETFLSYAEPDKNSFADALLGLKNSLEGAQRKALERLVQIGSHGSMEGIETFSPLSVEESIQAAKSTIALIRKRDAKHCEAMINKCQKCKK